MTILRRVIFGKLNLPLFRAVESATAFAKLRGNPHVELTQGRRAGRRPESIGPAGDAELDWSTWLGSRPVRRAGPDCAIDLEGLLADLREVVATTHNVLRLSVRDVERVLAPRRALDALEADAVLRQPRAPRMAAAGPPHLQDALPAARNADTKGATAAPVAAVSTREDMLHSIRTARGWFERHEPSSLVLVLLKQAERMDGKRFHEIADAIPLDLLRHWETADDGRGTGS